MHAAAVADFAESQQFDPPGQAQWRPMPIAFTGSGSEYFRIWIVNLLLSVLTLSLYMPYARARRLRYFHGNTLVDGQALGFHGSGHAMLRGHLLIVLFAAAYGLAGRFSPLAAGLAGGALALLWPALWQSSLRFRLANTSWRGLRMRFTGRVGGAYRSLLPALLPMACFLLLTGLRGQGGDEVPMLGAWADMAVVVSLLAVAATTPLLLARLKRYQHGHYHFAGETTTLDASPRDFYRLAFSGVGVVLAGTAVMLAAGSLLFSLVFTQGQRLDGVVLPVILGGGFWLLYLIVIVAVQASYAAALQNLVWGRTASPQLRFGSRLSRWAFARLGMKNMLLTVLTLGLYRPFAVVAATRLRLEAVSLQAQGSVDTWVVRAVGSAGDAAGDAAGDLLGVDLGL